MWNFKFYEVDAACLIMPQSSPRVGSTPPRALALNAIGI